MKSLFAATLIILAGLLAPIVHSAQIDVTGFQSCSYKNSTTFSTKCGCDVGDPAITVHADRLGFDANIPLVGDLCMGTLHILALARGSAEPDIATIIAGGGLASGSVAVSGPGVASINDVTMVINTDADLHVALDANGTGFDNRVKPDQGSSEFSTVDTGGGAGDLTGLVSIVDSNSPCVSGCDGSTEALAWSSISSANGLTPGSDVLVMDDSDLGGDNFDPNFSGTYANRSIIRSGYKDESDGSLRWYDEGSGTGRGVAPRWTGPCGNNDNPCIDLRDGEDYIDIIGINIAADGTSTSRFFYADGGNVSVSIRQVVWSGATGTASGAVFVDGAYEYWVIEDSQFLDMGDNPGSINGATNITDGVRFWDGGSKVRIINSTFSGGNHNALSVRFTEGYVGFSDVINNEHPDVAGTNSGYRAAEFHPPDAGYHDLLFEGLVIVGGNSTAATGVALKPQTTGGTYRYNTYKQWDTDGNADVFQLGPCCTSNNGLFAPFTAENRFYQSDILARAGDASVGEFTNQ
ncbi:MAG: hypothetical protein AAF438_06765, partial [Pseudomonadota bacterium]